VALGFTHRRRWLLPIPPTEPAGCVVEPGFLFHGSSPIRLCETLLKSGQETVSDTVSCFMAASGDGLFSTRL
jgi:hypothetical protein